MINSFLKALLALFSCFGIWGISGADDSEDLAPNVLFIAADDLGTILGCYGDDQVISPNIDRLASEGTLFNRAYCQQAICNVSRASLLTGLRPDTIGVNNLSQHFRQKVPDVVTLPEQFKMNGYHTQAFGKIFHPAFKTIARPESVELTDDQSWSVPQWRGSPPHYVTEEGIRIGREVFAKSRHRGDAPVDDWVKWNVRGLATETPDVADNRLNDGEMTDRAIVALRQLAGRKRGRERSSAREPFFLGVGYLKPHLPFVAPKKYWDLYDRDSIELAENDQPPVDAPPIALQVHWSGIRAQSDVPNRGALTEDRKREFRHGYYACVSYIDAQIGRLLDELDRLGLRENTIVVLWGDHGYSLGEHALWAKLTNFEDSTRSPLIVSAPGMKENQITNALVEFVDVYPSLCELADLPLPENLEGTSFVPLMKEPSRPWKTAAFSQYLRRGFQNYKVVPLDIPNPEGYDEYPKNGSIGYSMRTERYRFTIWQDPDDPEEIIAKELYDHAKDPGENVNVVGKDENKDLVADLTLKLRAGWAAARSPVSN